MRNNIVLICFKYPPEYSGYGKQLHSVITSMKSIKHNFNFTLLTAYKSSVVKKNKRVIVVPLESNLNNNRIVFYLFCIKVLFWLILNKNKYSIIHCIKAGPEAVIANLVSKLLRKRLIVKIAQDELSKREIESAQFFKRFSRKGRHLLLKYVENFIAISEEIEKNIKNNVSNKTKIIRIPNGVDNKRFYPVNLQSKKELRLKLKLSPDNTIILFAGAINKRKGVEDLLNALNYINNTNKCTLVICGPLQEEINLEKKIEKINKSKKVIQVIYRGVINNVDEYMKAADIFVLPSYSEGLPNVLLEAASSGLSLIATDIGGNRDIVKSGYNGFLVPVNSPKILGLKLSKLINNINLRVDMGIKAKEMIESGFTLEFVANSYIQLYENLTKKTNS